MLQDCVKQNLWNLTISRIRLNFTILQDSWNACPFGIDFLSWIFSLPFWGKAIRPRCNNKGDITQLGPQNPSRIHQHSAYGVCWIANMKKFIAYIRDIWILHTPIVDKQKIRLTTTCYLLNLVKHGNILPCKTAGFNFHQPIGWWVSYIPDVIAYGCFLWRSKIYQHGWIRILRLKNSGIS